jgi:SAM-dependent methyltransferase
MPGSSPEGKPQAIEMLRGLTVTSALDVGPGVGTWRALLAGVFPHARWTAIEIWEPYVAAYGLDRKYDQVIVGDAATIPLDGLDFDLAVFGDVIEHTPKTRAVEMVERLPWRHALISVPIVEYPQGECDGNPYEAHLATWSADDVLESFPVVEHWTGVELGVFLLAR